MIQWLPIENQQSPINTVNYHFSRYPENDAITQHFDSYLSYFVFLIHLEVQGHTVFYWKVLKHGKYEPKGQSCRSTLSIIYQDVLKNGSLLHKYGFVDSQMETTIPQLTNMASSIRHTELSRHELGFTVLVKVMKPKTKTKKKDSGIRKQVLFSFDGTTTKLSRMRD